MNSTCRNEIGERAVMWKGGGAENHNFLSAL